MEKAGRSGESHALRCSAQKRCSESSWTLGRESALRSWSHLLRSVNGSRLIQAATTVRIVLRLDARLSAFVISLTVLSRDLP